MSVEEAVAARERGIAKAKRRAGKRWCAAYYCCLVWCAHNFQHFTADDVRDRMKERFPRLRERAPSASGSCWRIAMKRGLVVNTGRTTMTRDAIRHRYLPIYESCVY